MSRTLSNLGLVVWICVTFIAPAESENPSPSFCRPDGRSVMLSGLREASGVAASRRTPGLAWTLNDSGEAMIVGVDASGKIRQRVQLTGVKVDDWEDVAVGQCPQGSCVYVADIGDNHAGRSRIAVYRIPEPEANETAATPEVFHATYPDRAHDAEALLVTPQQQLFIITKEAPSRLYRVPPSPKPGTNVRLELVRVLNEKDEITGASLSPDGAWIAARSNRALLLYRTKDFLLGDAEPLRIDLRPLKEPQGEGVSFADGDQLILVSEGGGGGLMTRLRCTLPR